MILASVAQWIEHRTSNPQVVGSTPTWGAFGTLAQLVAHRTFNPLVPSSSLGCPTICGCSSIGRASAFQAECCRFDSDHPLSFHRGVAQSGSASGLGPEGRRFKSYHPDFFRSMEYC